MVFLESGWHDCCRFYTSRLVDSGLNIKFLLCFSLTLLGKGRETKAFHSKFGNESLVGSVEPWRSGRLLLLFCLLKGFDACQFFVIRIVR